MVERLMRQQNDLAKHAALKYLSDMQVSRTTTSTRKDHLDSRGEACCTMPSVGAAKGPSVIRILYRQHAKLASTRCSRYCRSPRCDTTVPALATGKVSLHLQPA